MTALLRVDECGDRAENARAGAGGPRARSYDASALLLRSASSRVNPITWTPAPRATSIASITS